MNQKMTEFHESGRIVIGTEVIAMDSNFGNESFNIASFVDTTKDPQHYVDRYNNEPAYKEWFDEN